MRRPQDIAVLPNGDLLVTDCDDRIKRLDPRTGGVVTVAGNGEAGSADGVGSGARFRWLKGIATNPDGESATFCDGTRVRQVRLRQGAGGAEVTTLAGAYEASHDDALDTSRGHGQLAGGDGDSAAQFGVPAGIAVRPCGEVVVTDLQDMKVHAMPGAACAPARAPAEQPGGGTGRVRTLCGGGGSGGGGGGTQVWQPWGITVLPGGACAFAETGHHRVRLVTRKGHITTLAGAGAPRRAQTGHRWRRRATGPWQRQRSRPRCGWPRTPRAGSSWRTRRGSAW